MALATLVPTTTDHSSRHYRRKHHHHHGNKNKPPRFVLDAEEDEEEVRRRRKMARKRKKLQPVVLQTSPTSSWAQFKNLITCRTTADPSQIRSTPSGRLGSTCSKICAMKEVARNNTRIVHRGDHDHSPTSKEAVVLKPRSWVGGSHLSSKGLQLRKLTGCYECHSVTQPIRWVFRSKLIRCLFFLWIS